MGASTRPLPTHRPQVGAHNTGPVCKRGKPTGSKIRVLSPTTKFHSDRRILPTLAQPRGNHVGQPTVHPHPKNSTENRAGRGNINPDHPRVADSNVVANADRARHRSPPALPGQLHPRKLGDSRVAFIRQHARNNRLSQGAFQLLTGDANTTTATYDAAWRRFSRFAEENKVPISDDYFIADMEDAIIEFLHWCHQKGYAQETTNSTVTTLTQAIAATHDTDLNQSYRLALAKRHYAQLHPRQGKYAEIYDIDMIFTLLQTREPNRTLPIAKLREKVVILLKIDLMARSHDLTRIFTHPELFRLQDSGLDVRLHKTKNDRTLTPWIHIEPFGDDPRICTVEAVKCYLERMPKPKFAPTQLSIARRHIQAHPLILDLEGEKSLGSERIANITKDVLRTAGIDTERFTGHSVRAASITKAIGLGMPRQTVMQHARISSEQVLAKHYLKLETGKPYQVPPPGLPITHLLRFTVSSRASNNTN